MANGILYEAFKRLTAGEKTEIDRVSYNKGVIGGMKMLFMNLEENLEACKEFIKENKEKEEG